MSTQYVPKPRTLKVCRSCLKKIARHNQSTQEKFLCTSCEYRPNLFDRIRDYFLGLKF